MAKVKTEVRAREEMIKEKQQFLEQEIENNREQEKRIGISERIAAKIRAEYQEAEALRDQFQSEVNYYEGYIPNQICLPACYFVAPLDKFANTNYRTLDFSLKH